MFDLNMEPKQAIDGRGSNLQQFFFAARRESQFAELLELSNQLWHDRYQAFAATVSSSQSLINCSPTASL